MELINDGVLVPEWIIFKWKAFDIGHKSLERLLLPQYVPRQIWPQLDIVPWPLPHELLSRQLIDHSIRLTDINTKFFHRQTQKPGLLPHRIQANHGQDDILLIRSPL